MNGRWMTYNGNPALYIAAWRHIHDIFAAAGATNAVWVWSPDAVDVPATTSNHWSADYPGDGYVDWVGVDGYNWSSTEAPRTFSQIFQPFYRDYAGRKPVMVAETASCEERVDKAAWIRGAAAQIRASFPEIKALIWFNADKECDWRINSSAAALRAFVTSFASEPYFAGRAGAPRRDTPSLTGPA
jgi:beta-mannanase